jgi:transketolase
VSEPGYESILLELGGGDPRVLVLDAGLGTSMRTELFRRACPERYFNLGIAEQNAVGVASGLARRGFVPLVHSFSNFIARRAHEQVALSVAWPRCNVKLIGGSCGLFDGRNGPSHMAIDDLSAMAALPGMTVVEPGDAGQTRAMLAMLLSGDGPAYLRLRRNGPDAALLSPGDAARATAGLRRHDAPRCTLVSCGTMLEETLAAAHILETGGVPFDLIHVAVLAPLDATAIVDSALRSRCVITVENHAASGGFGDAVARAIGPRGIPHARLALPDRLVPAGDAGWQLAWCELDASSIARRVEAFMKENRG